ncbi:MAG TPA: thioesterase [Cryomorphaceae bacterium]|nr:thioesterase [Owenweeksia sp.]HAD97196.1 thioesterase [Cryomorphaceae bacterium]HBF19337.1 thioesterase [Cryomorphaceae bacterium]HCQ14641.1 thioesterase [Cryomorphaceae bacterium]|tara:strand:- start:911 stop:1324 length:414 start_codon:yes stop_codon:yes gene_type:complete
MFVKRTAIRVRYAETDQMGVVYYGNYPQYFEVGRVEALRTLGMSYREMEEGGIMLPVVKLEIQYIRPALYDDLLTIDTRITEMPSTRITFHHEVFNEEKVLLTKGLVQLVFLNRSNRRPCKAPEDFLSKIEPYFSGG